MASCCHPVVEDFGSSARYCAQCGAPVDLETAQARVRQLEQRLADAEQRVRELEDQCDKLSNDGARDYAEAKRLRTANHTLSERLAAVDLDRAVGLLRAMQEDIGARRWDALGRIEWYVRELSAALTPKPGEAEPRCEPDHIAMLRSSVLGPTPWPADPRPGEAEPFGHVSRANPDDEESMTYEPPRRDRIDQFTPAERAIWDAAQAVEAAGADVRLTEALNLLHAARAKVADYVDSKPADPRPERCKHKWIEGDGPANWRCADCGAPLSGTGTADTGASK